MWRSDSDAHLSEERIQDWLDGRLPPPDAAAVEGHVGACPRCRAEVEGWRALMGELSGLEALAPQTGFSGRVLDAVEGPTYAEEARGRRAGALATVSAWLSGSGHPDTGRLQDFVDGALGRRAAAGVRRHLAACAPCRTEARGWARVIDGVGRLPRHAPSPAFAHEVMRHVRVTPAHATTGSSLAQRLLGRARALGGRRRAWAAAAGVAFTPVVTAGLVLYAVFSHPMVTLGGLATFVWLKTAALTTALGGGIGGGLFESASIFRAWSALRTLSPTTAGAGLLAVSALTLASGWVVYRNVIAPLPRVARVER